MRNYRIVKDNFLGYEAQVKFSFFPFVWFQMHDFFWINTFPTPELARQFIEQRIAGVRKPVVFHHSADELHEYEKEVKLLLFQANKSRRETVWSFKRETTAGNMRNLVPANM